MYAAKIYKIMFGAPSDIDDEYKTFIDIINGWNGLFSEKYRIL